MNTFIELWQGAVNRSSKSLYQLANETKIERSYLSKVGLGKRLPPDREWIKKVLDAVGCCDTECKQIIREWSRAMLEAKFGCNAGECMDAISIFLGRAYGIYIERKEAALESQKLWKDRLRDAFLKAEREKRIDIWGGEYSDWFAENLEALMGRGEIVCRHIMGLNSADPGIGEDKNLEILGRYIPCVCRSASYSPRIYYKEKKNEGMIGKVLGCILYLSDQVIFIDRDFRLAICFEEKEQVEILKNKFEMAYLDSHAVFAEYQTAQSVGEQKQMVEKNGAELYLLNRPTELVHWQEWRRGTVRTVKEHKELADKWKIFEHKEKYVHILPVENLGLPMEKMGHNRQGKSEGDSSGRTLLDSILETQEYRDGNLQIFSSKDYPQISHLTMAASSERFNYLIIRTPGGGERTLFLAETGLAYWSYWFLYNLGRGYMLPDRAEQLRLLCEQKAVLERV